MEEDWRTRLYSVTRTDGSMYLQQRAGDSAKQRNIGFLGVSNGNSREMGIWDLRWTQGREERERDTGDRVRG